MQLVKLRDLLRCLNGSLDIEINRDGDLSIYDNNQLICHIDIRGENPKLYSKEPRKVARASIYGTKIKNNTLSIYNYEGEVFEYELSSERDLNEH